MIRWHHLRASLLIVTAATAPAIAQSHLSVNIVGGRVSLLAQNVSLRAILEEWTRANGTAFVNADRLPDTLVSLQLTDLSQREAVATLLRGVGGYVIAQGTDGPDRIVILAHSTPVNSLARAAESVFQAPEPAAFAGDVPDAGPIPVPGRAMTHSDGSDSQPMAAGPTSAPAGVAAKSVPFVRINSSDAITDVVNGVDPGTVVPRELRPPTTIFVSIPEGSVNTPGAITTIGTPPPGIIYARPTDPNAIKTQGTVPATPAPRK